MWGSLLGRRGRSTSGPQITLSAITRPTRPPASRQHQPQNPPTEPSPPPAAAPDSDPPFQSLRGCTLVRPRGPRDELLRLLPAGVARRLRRLGLRRSRENSPRWGLLGSLARLGPGSD